MQFFPYTATTQSVSALNGASQAAQNISEASRQALSSGNDFLDTLNAELAAAGVSPIAAPEGVSEGAPKGFSTVAQQSSTFSDEDIKNLRDNLKKRGVSDEQLKALEEAMKSGQTPSLGTLMNTMLGKGRSSEILSEEERLHLGSALRKMGFNQDEIAELESMADNGQGSAMMQRINRRINGMEPSQRVTLDKSELASIARALDLSAKNMGHTLAAFGDNEQLSVTGEGIRALLAHAGKELTEKEAGIKKVAKEIKDALEETLQAQRLRKKNQGVSDNRVSKFTGRAETRMRDDLTAKANGLGPEAQDARWRELDEENNHIRRDHAGEEDSKDARKDADAKSFLAAVKQDAKSGAKENRESRDSFDNSFARVSGEGIFSAAPQTTTAPGAPQAPVPRPAPDTLFTQIEKGLLKELSDGSRQLTLRLDPAELGQLTVQLNVYKGEVRALFRTESSEATAALTEQMAQLKASLEEQGLKVTELDVQTQLREDPSMQQWDGTSQYNKEQEMREQSRMIRLARLRQEAGTDLARDMHSIERREEISSSGLHIIA